MPPGAPPFTTRTRYAAMSPRGAVVVGAGLDAVAVVDVDVGAAVDVGVRLMWRCR